MHPFNRRFFLKAGAMSVLPAIIPASHAFAASPSPDEMPPSPQTIKLFGDGEMFEPTEYIGILQKINAAKPIGRDRYGVGGEVELLEKKMAEITGKEKAIFLPSGTMANQLAISVLSADNNKVFLQETSHVYRDEADAAQSVFRERLMPLAKDQPYFTAEELKQAIAGLPEAEAFKTGIGAVSIENPVRRTDGKTFPIEEIKKISQYCKTNNIRMHLDGARLFMASAWTGVSIKEYASYFDTVYISMYKYLGASAGAVLCGDKAVIDKIPHLMKVHGGSMYTNWTNAAVALHRIEGFEDRLQQSIAASKEIFAALNKLPGVNISPLAGGSNIYDAQLPTKINGKSIQEKLLKEFNIRLPRPDENGKTKIWVNETLIYQPASYVIQAIRSAAGL